MTDNAAFGNNTPSMGGGSSSSTAISGYKSRGCAAVTRGPARRSETFPSPATVPETAGMDQTAEVTAASRMTETGRSAQTCPQNE